MKKYWIPISVLSVVAFYALALNGNYYRLYFLDSGYPGRMPVLMALFFISAELVLWAFSNQKNAVSIALKYGLVVFSVFATLSSQYTSTSELEAKSAQIVYEKVDISGDIARYEEQIKKQDDRIDSIYRQREENFMFSRTEDSLEFAQSEKARYENLLKELKAENKTEVEDVYTVSSIYAWFAVDLPRIFRSGVTEEFIRILFQLFSSLILASMAPVTISIIRGIKPDVETEIPDSPEQQATPQRQVSDTPATYQRQTPPVTPRPAQNKAPAILKISRQAKSDIVKMLYWYRENNNGSILTPEKASDKFADLNRDDPSVKPYSVKECQAVWDEIVSRGIQNNKYDDIREELGL